MAAYGGTGSLTGQSYGDLSANDAFTIQKRMLPIAKRLQTFAKFAQRETKPQKQGLEIRHRRYERFPIVDNPVAEGVTPDFTSLEHTTLKHTLKQYGSYVNTTDVMLAASHDPVLQVITERQAQQAGETLDFLAYKVFRAGTSVKHVGTSASARSDVDYHIGNAAPVAGDPCNSGKTSAIQTAVRQLEANDAKKLRNKLRASVGIATEPIRESYIAVCHPDLRQDIEALPGFVVASKYSDQGDAMEGEIGAVEGVRFITTTQATPFKDAGDSVTQTSSVNDEVSTSGSKADVYPVIIMAEDFGGCATLGGMDSLRSKVVMPKPGPGDPLGQRGTVAWDTFYSCIILQDLWMYRLEVVATKL